MMVDSWRRQRSDNYNQEVTGTRSQIRKPPLGNWQPTVPSWEKKFCTVVGSVPWPKVLQNKKFIHLYDNILEWNDSAGEEAFHNAKNRFWAEINGLHCDISLPDPDIYIDKIDWNLNVDPELLLDLERESEVPADRENSEQVVIFSEPLVPSQLFSSTGWGDAEEDLKKITNPPLENRENPWDISCAWDNGAGRENGWEEGWNNSQGWNMRENNNCDSDNLKDRRVAGVWEPWDANNMNGENTGRSMSRYKTSRFHGDDHREWRNGKGRKGVNFVCEQPFTDKRPVSRQWSLMNSCGPVSHHGSANPGDQWSWEKPVT